MQGINAEPLTSRLPSEGEGWVKGGEGSAQPFTSRTPSVYRGFSRFGEE